MTTYPLPTLACTVDSSGISAPAFPDILLSLQASAQSIFGNDIVLDPSSQDGQQLAVIAKAIDDSNKATIAAYNNMSPTTGQGTGLSSMVKINGLRRKSATSSTVVVTITGVYGTVIDNGVVGDVNGNRWDLPASVTIPLAATIDVTATAEDAGAITADIGQVNSILTPTAGWHGVTNAAAATVGAPVESDAELRERQTESVAIPAETVLEGIIGAVANVAGVQRHAIYENDTDAPDGDGIPAHSICVVAEGGAVQDIVNAIGSKKPPGTGTFGTTTGTYADPAGVNQTINYEVLSAVPITVQIDVTKLAGWVDSTSDAIKQAVVDYINGQTIGEDVYYRRLYAPAALNGVGLGLTFNLTDVLIARSGAPAAADVAIAFNEAASCAIGNVTVTAT